jgi:hypothetical protein
MLTLTIDPEYSADCQGAIALLRRSNISRVFTLQNASEFWNTCTRPLTGNGLAMEPATAAHALRLLLTQFAILPDTSAVFERWLDLVVRYEVRGVQVHDAKLVAATQAHGFPAILTLNDADFRRYDEVQVYRPEEISV